MSPAGRGDDIGQEHVARQEASDIKGWEDQRWVIAVTHPLQSSLG